MIKAIAKKIQSKVFTKQNTEYPSVITQVVADELTFLEKTALLDIYLSIQKCEKSGINGIFIEAGCAAGGSAIVMAAAKSKIRSLIVYDVFGMIPEPSEKDGPDVHERYDIIKSGKANGTDTKLYYGYRPNLLAEVKSSFHLHGFSIDENKIKLVPGLFEDTIKGDEEVALAHIDGDWYDSVTVCLERLAPRLVRGGRFIIDDYYAWPGCRTAVDDFLKVQRSTFFVEKHARVHLVKR
jgi:asparagine synthase (glutamine-hydrolysing)